MDTETAFTTPTTAFVTDWTRLAWRLSPAIQAISRPARFAVITFRFMPDYDDLLHAELPALYEGISQLAHNIYLLRILLVVHVLDSPGLQGLATHHF
jgi:hypothetical protein